MTVKTAAARTVLLAGVDAAVLVGLRPRWTAVTVGLAHPRAWLASGPDAALATASGTLLWVVAVWVAIGLTAGVGARLPGAIGRRCARCAQVVLPRVLLGVVIGSTGLGLLAAPAAQSATPMTARPPAVGCVQGTAAPSASWLGGGPGVPAPTWPVGTDTGASHALPPPTPPMSDPSMQRVRPGDSLWLLAARRLGPHSGDQDVTQYWPQIYAANRSVIGDDPSVIHPGQVLDLPAPTQESR